MSSTFFQRFNLFIPGKTAQKIEQPQYGTDMRTIEIWSQTLFGYILNEFDSLITSIHQLPLFELPSVMVGTTPASTVQLIARMFIESVTVTAGATSVALSGFSHGYNALVVGADNPAVVYTLNPGASTLTSLHLTAYNGSGTPFAGADSVSVLVVGA